MKNSCAVITRFHYPLNSRNFEWRLNYYKKKVLPRLLRQTDGDFDIAIWCGKHHDHIFQKLGVKIFKAPYIGNKGERTLHDYNRWENVSGLEKYDIQIGLDSDDLVSPDFISKIRGLCDGVTEETLISVQPVKMDFRTGKKYRMHNYEKRKRCSPCFAIYQPDKSSFRFAYYRSHYRMNFDFKNVIYLPEGYVTMTVNHGHNDSTRIIPREDRPI